MIYCKDSDSSPTCNDVTSKQLVFQTQCQRDGEDDACNLLQASMQVSFETLIGALHQSCMGLTTSRGSNGAGAAMSINSWMNPKKKVFYNNLTTPLLFIAGNKKRKILRDENHA